MSRLRRLFVSGVLVALVAGHLVDAWKQRDHWPFAAYPMFAGVNKPEPFTSEDVRGITADGREVAVTSRQIGVLHRNRVRPSLVRLYNHSRRTDSPQPHAAEIALAGLLKHYEIRRQQNEHDGPPLVGMRFYRLTWQFDWWARNRATPRRAVLFETTAAPGTTTNPALTTSPSPAPPSLPQRRRR